MRERRHSVTLRRRRGKSKSLVRGSSPLLSISAPVAGVSPLHTRFMRLIGIGNSERLEHGRRVSGAM
jgi:hypothetical protein